MSGSDSDSNRRVVEEITAIVGAAAAKYLTEESEPAFTYEISASSQSTGDKENAGDEA